MQKNLNKDQNTNKYRFKDRGRDKSKAFGGRTAQAGNN